MDWLINWSIDWLIDLTIDLIINNWLIVFRVLKNNFEVETSIPSVFIDTFYDPDNPEEVKQFQV